MLIGLSGPARVGKDSVASILVTHHGYTRVAFADKMKTGLYALNPWITPRTNDRDLEHYFDAFPSGTWPLRTVVDKVGWEVAKKLPEVRVLLQRFGTEAGREVLGEDVWIRAAFPNGVHWTENVVVSDVRFDNESRFIRASGGIVVHLSRPGIGPVNSHVSEQGVTVEIGDYELENAGEKEGWRGLVEGLLREVNLQIREERVVKVEGPYRPLGKAYEREYLR